MDIDSCQNVLIEGCSLSVGDDGIALKSGSGEDGVRVNKPTAHVLVRNCVVNDGHGGIVIGSETAGGIHNISVEDCVFSGTDRGIRIKTRRGRGGKIHDLKFNNLTMTNNTCPLSINMYYRCGADPDCGCFTMDTLPVDEFTPSIKNISIENIHAHGCKASAGFMVGLPEAPIENLSLRDSSFSTDEESAVTPDNSDMYTGLPFVDVKSIRILNVKNLKHSGVTVKGPKEAFIYG
jgi:polygalacturonase